MVMEVEDDAHARPPVEPEHVGEVEQTLVVLDDQPPPRTFRERLVGARPAIERPRPAVVPAPDVDDDDGLRALPSASRRSTSCSTSRSDFARNAGSGLLRTVYCPGWVESRRPNARAFAPSAASSSWHSAIWRR